MKILKKTNNKSAEATNLNTGEIVRKMLSDIKAKREEAAKQYAFDLDGWDGDILVPNEEIVAAADKITDQTKEDIHFAYDKVRRFAEAQRKEFRDFEIEIEPGLVAGQRNVPVQAAGCYVPGGRYSHIASAIMTVTAAKVAGVDHVIACSPPRVGEGVPPSILYALNLCGADSVLALGGVQGVAALAYGLFTGHAADVLAGPGNQYVAEAKRVLYGQVGIDMFAGPTEILMVVDETSDPEIVATDLVGQAEHGPNSPAWLISLSEKVATDVMKLIPELIDDLPEPNKGNAKTSWADFGEVCVADNREEAVELSDSYAAEHLEIHCSDLEWWLGRLRNYGSLFLGEETTVAFGDKASGPNHVLPTKGAARYTGGLSVGKFIKTLTWQRMTRDANQELAPVVARISRYEGMEAHARTADIRLNKWFPNGDI